MRDVNRIDPFLAELGYLWKTNAPDWRFGQLISNVLGEEFGRKGRDIFFPEEDEMIKAFRHYFNAYNTDQLALEEEGG